MQREPIGQDAHYGEKRRGIARANEHAGCDGYAIASSKTQHYLADAHDDGADYQEQAWAKFIDQYAGRNLG